MGDPYKVGLAHIRAGRYFEAQEELELVWRAAPSDERDFYQGPVHVAVAWYHAGRGRPVATARQRGQAARRLTPFPPGRWRVGAAAVPPARGRRCGQERRTVQHGAGVACEDEDGGEDGADARSRAHRERAAEERARPAPRGACEESGGEQTVRQGK